MKNHRLSNKVGQKFGKLTVLESAGIENNCQIWKVRCECGTVRTIPNDQIFHAKSCGCGRMDDVVGQKFGRLTIIRSLGTRPTNGTGMIQWVECVCDCGNTKEVVARSLKAGLTKSCGCLKSAGEEWLARWLSDNEYTYKRQYRIPECRNKRPLPFDFAVWIDSELRLIEYQSLMHYKSDRRCPHRLEYRVKLDRIKADYCWDNGIPLLKLLSVDPDKASTLEQFLTEPIYAEFG